MKTRNEEDAMFFGVMIFVGRTRDDGDSERNEKEEGLQI